MNIRGITAAEIPALRDIAIKIYCDTFAGQNTPENLQAFIDRDYSVESFEKEFADPRSWYFFIEDGKTIAGYLRLRVTSEVEHLLGTNTLEIHRLYVDPSYHGKKVGDQLMQFSIDTATEGKYDWIWLGVWEHNPRAQRFYQKWNFEKFSEHPFHMGDEAQTDWLLKRKI